MARKWEPLPGFYNVKDEGIVFVRVVNSTNGYGYTLADNSPATSWAVRKLTKKAFICSIDQMNKVLLTVTNRIK